MRSPRHATGDGGDQIPESPFQLRAYQPEDLDRLYTLDVLCFKPPFRFSRAVMRRVVSAPGAIVILAVPSRVSSAAIQEELLGFCAVNLEAWDGETVGYVATLDVDPTVRRLGVGTALMQAAEASLQTAGVAWMVLHVFTGNTGAVRLYEALGFLRWGEQQDFYARGLHAWVYGKRVGH